MRTALLSDRDRSPVAAVCWSRQPTPILTHWRSGVLRVGTARGPSSVATPYAPALLPNRATDNGDESNDNGKPDLIDRAWNQPDDERIGGHGGKHAGKEAGRKLENALRHDIEHKLNDVAKDHSIEQWQHFVECHKHHQVLKCAGPPALSARPKRQRAVAAQNAGAFRVTRDDARRISMQIRGMLCCRI